MPAVFDALVKQQALTPHVAWRVSFIVPTILLIATGLGALLLCDDTPTGVWSSRGVVGVVPVFLPVNDSREGSTLDDKMDAKGSNTKTGVVPANDDDEANIEVKEVVLEVVQKPSLRSALPALFCLQTLMLGASHSAEPFLRSADFTPPS